jgi:hypothetical protein
VLGLDDTGFESWQRYDFSPCPKEQLWGQRQPAFYKKFTGVLLWTKPGSIVKKFA